MEITSLSNRFRSKATRVSLALLALTIATLWGVQIVYSDMTRTALATHEFDNWTEWQSRVYITYEDFNEDGLIVLYTYHYINPMEGCIGSFKMSIDTNTVSDISIGGINPSICPGEGDDTIYTNWNQYEIDFEPNNTIAHLKSRVYEGAFGLASGGWAVDFEGDDVSIDNYCIQSYGNCDD